MNQHAGVVACAALVCASLAAADHKDVNRTAPLSPAGIVELDTHKGSVRVSTWTRPQVEIHARIEAASGASEDQRLFDHADVAIHESADSVRIETKYESNTSGTNPDVHYTIQMPRTARLRIRDHRSDIQIRDLAAALDIDTHRGTTRVDHLGGPLKLVTYRGDAEVDFASFTGESQVETHRGSIQLLLPNDSRFELRAAFDRRGSIESDFPMLARLARRPGANIEGTVNGGGPALRLSTERGKIRVKSK